MASLAICCAFPEAPRGRNELHAWKVEFMPCSLCIPASSMGPGTKETTMNVEMQTFPGRIPVPVRLA